MSLEWKNQAGLSNYPFTSEASLTDIDGISRLERDDIVDLLFYQLSPDETNLFVSSITASDDSMSLVISCDLGEVASATFLKSAAIGKRANLLGMNGEARGMVIFGDNPSTFFSNVIPGEAVEFDLEGTAILATCIFAPTLAQVSSITIGGTPLFGRVRIKAGIGVQLSALDHRRVVVHALGAQVAGDCNLSLPIQKINGVSPNSVGGLLIKEEAYATPTEDTGQQQILRVKQTEHGIILSLPELKTKP